MLTTIITPATATLGMRSATRDRAVSPLAGIRFLQADQVHRPSVTGTAKQTRPPRGGPR